MSTTARFKALSSCQDVYVFQSLWAAEHSSKQQSQTHAHPGLTEKLSLRIC